MNPTFGAIRIDRLTLYRITESNAGYFRNLILSCPGTEAVLHEYDACYLPRYEADGRQKRFGFFAYLDGEPAGLSMLVVDDWENGHCYTGADCLPHMRGRGVTPGSKAHLFYLAFELLGLNRLYTGTSASNLASRRSLEKTPGMEMEGILREYVRIGPNEFEDEYRYAILKRDWLRLYDRSRVELLPEDQPQ